MEYWLISDTHFNHDKIEQWGGRSGNWQKQIWNGLAQMPKEDILIHLGDVCIGDDTRIHMDLKGLPHYKKILVRGNHDKKSHSWYTDHGWDFVCDGLDLTYHGHYLKLTHRPRVPVDYYSYNIHGHTHGNLHRSEEYIAFYDKSYHVDISPELVGFAPIKLGPFLDTISKKPRRTPE